MSLAKSKDPTSDEEYRIEKDYMGQMRVPHGAYYGAQTQRAVENFPISGLVFPRSMIAAMGTVKRSAAIVNAELGLLDETKLNALVQTAEEVENGTLDEHFVVDIFQTGSGTSTNMNTNEVMARRANELSGASAGIHPNDHVNMSQSSNDVIPTAIHIAVAVGLRNKLLPALNTLQVSLGEKAAEFSQVVKTGRTHLQDATPITLGQEFSGYQSQIEHSVARIERSLPSILELPLGGTAVGTGLNTPAEFAKKVIAAIAERTGIAFVEADNHFEAQAAKDGMVEMSGQLKTIACSLTKIANDIRWLSSGPRCGIGELHLPEVQPGSSIMPGKINPVIAESVLMACAQVIGNDQAVCIGGHSGSVFELNVMMPMMAYNILQSIDLLAASAENFAERCVAGIKANKERLTELAEASIAICTALAPRIGYDRAAALAKEAFKSGKSLREVATSQQVLPAGELEQVLNLMAMTKPGV